HGWARRAQSVSEHCRRTWSCMTFATRASFTRRAKSVRVWCSEQRLNRWTGFWLPSPSGGVHATPTTASRPLVSSKPVSRHEQGLTSYTDVIHTICYSIMLLNTDLHMADIEQKMTRSQFVK